MMAIATENCAYGPCPATPCPKWCVVLRQGIVPAGEFLATDEGEAAPPPTDVARADLDIEPTDHRHEGLIAPQDTVPLQVALAVYACSWQAHVSGEEIRAAWVAEDKALREGVWNVCFAALTACGKLPQLQSLRSAALKVLAIEPALGQQLVADLAAIDAALQLPG